MGRRLGSGGSDGGLRIWPDESTTRIGSGCWDDWRNGGG